ncbi:hypothetical protein WL21_04670 [Burkholderia ubonensis]|uniref:type III secretion system gatekeeper subunit SctW n=1 Tax=Burkholderia ubonensis TaxID=101571 RepID=UPI00075660F9|nr:type III secretion system gatekeeper subunit SctW [Burkholderia ubonensis]KVO87680.1 hypothetical protein WJ81_15640 [Burkholderia ubonensis]KVZ57297.1 hypothetical protein WL20_23425 [Burkholderia ubonensis]KVZ72994.1 hypothetical protein WL21_04670 [Burkholderia ubonensis]
MAQINRTSPLGAGAQSMQTRMLTEARRNDARRLGSETSLAPDLDELALLEELSPADLQQRLADLAGQMGSIATQFQRRREFERKRNGDSDSFDRVLDEEVESKAENLLQILKPPRTSADLQRLLDQARQLFSDESDLYAVLKELLKRKQLTRVQKTTLRALLEQAEQQANPKSLKAGVNCALKAKLFGRKLQVRPQLLRRTYRNFLECDGAVLSEYEDWIGTYGHEPRHVVMTFVGESLWTDIHAADPSCSLAEFGYLIGHVKKLQRLRSADVEFVGGLFQQAMLAETSADDGFTEEQLWLWALCAFLRNDESVRAILLKTVGGRMAQLTERQRAVLLGAVRRSYRALPDELFVNDRNLDEVSDDFDQMMDVAFGDELLATALRNRAGRTE